MSTEKPLPCPFCGLTRLIATRHAASSIWTTYCVDTDCWSKGNALCGAGASREESIVAWNALVAPEVDPVRAALAVPGVGDALRDLADGRPRDRVRPDALIAALRVLADAAEASR